MGYNLNMTTTDTFLTLDNDTTNQTTTYWYSGGYEYVGPPDFLLDCQIGVEEGIMLAFETFFFVVNLCLIVYFSSRMKKHSGNLKTKYKILITICNVLYLCQNITSFINSNIQYYSFHACYDRSDEVINTVRWVSTLIWERSWVTAVIMVYFLFIQRFQDGLKDSILELTKLKRFFQLTYFAFFIFWVWTLFVIILLILRSYYQVLFPDFWDFYIKYDLNDTRPYIWDLYLVASSIAIISFIYKFRQLLLLTTSLDPVGTAVYGADRKPHHQQRKYEAFLKAVSRTVVLATIALLSTLIMVLMVDYWMQLSPNIGMNVFWFEFIVLYLNLDSTINILCVNLQYSYAMPLYQRLNCFNLEKVTKKCILKCYNFDSRVRDLKCACFAKKTCDEQAVHGESVA